VENPPVPTTLRSAATLAAIAVLVALAGCAGPAGAAGDETPRRDASPPAALGASSGASMEDPVEPTRSKSGYDVTPLSRSRVAELAKKLTPEQYRVTQRAGTEPAFCGTLLDNKKEGTYVCVVCGLPLFGSAHKFESGTGWPSFYTPFDPDHVGEERDASHGMVRTEIHCARCRAHLGHVFEDGPRPTGLRYCLNSASLRFVDAGGALPDLDGTVVVPDMEKPSNMETAYFAGGCFWGIEHYFQKGPGVISAESGYMQGAAENPDYKKVCSGSTGHAETVKVVFDPTRITYRRLLEAFFKMHDPTELNRQGPDVGTQYRSGIWATSDKQLEDAKAYVKELAASKAFGGRPIVTQIERAKTFYPAEEYHQDYIEKTGRACHVTDPWPKEPARR
jgi:peptide methionine sulfoxide reductase msrA/msrB